MLEEILIDDGVYKLNILFAKRNPWVSITNKLQSFYAIYIKEDICGVEAVSVVVEYIVLIQFLSKIV